VISTAVMLWLVVACLLIARLRRSIVRLNKRASLAADVGDARVAKMAASLALELGLHKQVRILQAADTTPMTWGHRRPVILMPEAAVRWSDNRLRRVLLHELAHVKRADWLAQIAADLGTASYWFNPLVWVAAQRMRAEREYACDDVVLLSGARSSSYANDLVEIVRGARHNVPSAIAGLSMVGSTPLHNRLRALLDTGRSRHGLARGNLLAALAVAALLTLLLATAQPALARADLAGLKSAPMISPCWQLVRGVRITHLKREPTTSHLGFTRRRCSAEMFATGEIGFNEEFTGVVSMATGSALRMTERRGGVTRELAVQPDRAGKPDFSWTVDGERHPFNADVERWLERELLVLFRVAGFASDLRADVIMDRGGMQGLLQELPKLLWTTRAYEERLLRRVSEDDSSLVRLVTTSRSALSDDGLSDALVALAPRTQLRHDSTLRARWLAAAADIQTRTAYGRAMAAFLNAGGER
jgi:hypothetical protein